MFSLQRKIKPPTPPCLDEDSQGVASDEDSKLSSSTRPTANILSSDSDSGGEEESLPTASKEASATQPISKSKPQWSSDESGKCLFDHTSPPPTHEMWDNWTPLQLVLGVGGEGGCFPMPSRPHLTVKEAQHNLYQPSSILLLFSVLLCIFDHPTCFTLLSLILDLDFSRPFLSY